MRSLLIAAVAVASLAAASTGASAQTHEAPAARRLAIASVDFRDPAAVRVLYKRLQQAALEACDAQTVGLGKAVNRDQDCTAQTLAAAVRDVNRPLLTAEYQQHEAIRTARGY